MGLRIAVGGFMHETNTFVAKPTTWNDFVEAGPWPTLTIGEGVLSTFRSINLAIAYFESGNQSMAAAEARTLQRLDPKLYEKYLRETM